MNNSQLAISLGGAEQTARSKHSVNATVLKDVALGDSILAMGYKQIHTCGAGI
jgi:hypothetical protein